MDNYIQPYDRWNIQPYSAEKIDNCAKDLTYFFNSMYIGTITPLSLKKAKQSPTYQARQLLRSAVDDNTSILRMLNSTLSSLRNLPLATIQADVMPIIDEYVDNFHANFMRMMQKSQKSSKLSVADKEMAQDRLLEMQAVCKTLLSEIKQVIEDKKAAATPKIPQRLLNSTKGLIQTSVSMTHLSLPSISTPTGSCKPTNILKAGRGHSFP